MKRIYLFLAIMLNALLSSAQFSGSGSGTEEDPYLIYNPIQLSQLSNAKSSYFRLMQDIDMSAFLEENNPEIGWEPIGTTTTAFTGTFDGNNHKVSGLYINKPSTDYVGLFGKLSGKVKDLTLEYTYLKGGSYTGAIAGTGGSISNCKVKVSSTNGIEGTDYVGGIIGSGSNILNCSFEGNVYGHNNVGGISGGNANVTYTGLTVKGNIYSNGVHCGGICGICKKITNCKFYGYISGQSFVGGITGSSYGEVSNCYANCEIYGASTVGGIVGFVRASENIQCSGNVHMGNLIASDEVGGVCGYYSYYNGSGFTGHYSLTSSVSIGNITGTKYVGGIVGKSYGYMELNDCYFNGNISGDTYIGGISGSAVYRCYRNHVLSHSIIGQQNVGGICVGGSVYKSVAIIDRLEASNDIACRISPTNENTSNTNLALTTMKVISKGEIQDVTNEQLNGVSTGAALLKLKATYVARGWDFENMWSIQETECYPYLNYQTAPPFIESEVKTGITTVSGNTVEDGTVYLSYNNKGTFESTSSANHQWSVTTSPLVAGYAVKAYAESEGLYPSYIVNKMTKYNGGGTEANPYLISTVEELANIESDGYYKLAKTIDLTEWIQQNSPTTGWRAISGRINFDGGGYTITGLWSNTSSDFAGLFGNLRAGSSIKDLKVTVANNKSVSGTTYAGALVAHINGSVTNCSASGTVSGTVNVGGLIGLSETGVVSKSSFEGTVSATEKDVLVGGLVGNLKSGTITQSKTNIITQVSGTSGRVGGLVGSNDGTISECMSEGTVNATGATSYTGGLVGLNNASVVNCFSKAKTNGTQYTGGLIGYSFGTIDKTYAIGDISGVYGGGGVVGEIEGESATISNSVAMNNRMDLTANSSWAGRVLGGYKSSANEPERNNYALATMQVSLNNIPKTIYDDPVEGIAKTEAELKTASFYSSLGWDMSSIWGITEGESYPYLKWKTESSTPEEGNTEATILVTGIQFDNTTISITKGKTKNIIVTVNPTNATNKNITWESSNTNVATVSNGTVTAVKAGTATITATTTDGTNLSASCTVTVTEEETEETNPATDISSLPNVVYVNEIETTAGATIKIPVSLKNQKEDIVGFQFDLFVPEGVNLLKNSRGKIQAPVFNAETERTSTEFHVVSASELEEGIKVLCYSNENEIILGTDGVVFDFTATIADGMAEGEYDIILKNLVITNSALEQTKIDQVVSKLIIPSYTLGDVNGDKEINVTDIAATASYILGTVPASFVFKAADINADDDINVTDIAGIANIILSGNTSSAKSRNAVNLDYTSSIAINRIVTIPNTGSAIMHLGLNSSKVNVVTGFQCDVYLPEGIAWASNSRGGLSSPSFNAEITSHVASASEKSDGGVRMLCYSIENETLVSNVDDILNIPLVIDSQMEVGEYNVILKNIVITDASMRQIKIASCTYRIMIGDNNSVSIDSVNGSAEPAEVYDMLGIKHSANSSLPSGVYIVNGKKVIKK